MKMVGKHEGKVVICGYYNSVFECDVEVCPTFNTFCIVDYIYSNDVIFQKSQQENVMIFLAILIGEKRVFFALKFWCL